MATLLKRTKADRTSSAVAVAVFDAANRCLAIAPSVKNRLVGLCLLGKLLSAKKLNFLVVSVLFLKINR